MCACNMCDVPPDTNDQTALSLNRYGPQGNRTN